MPHKNQKKKYVFSTNSGKTMFFNAIVIIHKNRR